MNVSKHIAKHFRSIYFGGNWTSVNWKDTLKNVTWEQATQKIGSLNTILTLTYHSTYYTTEVLKVLEGGALVAKDKDSFNHPPITCEADWQQLLEKAWLEAEKFADLVEALPESQFEADFTDKNYGNYYSNLNGLIEHLHYHLGQVTIIKKLINSK
jgi:hypothetical protein